MVFATIVSISLILQFCAVYFSFRLIRLTGHTRVWSLLSLGIATMAARRFITFMTLMSTPETHTPMSYSYEIIGCMGSMMILAGVIAIKPFFIFIKNAEVEKRKLAENLQEALDHIKVLNDILPICANCKKIRDDEGYWEQIETYISNNSDTQFSHSICPECVKLLYPDYYLQQTKNEIQK